MVESIDFSVCSLARINYRFTERIIAIYIGGNEANIILDVKRGKKETEGQLTEETSMLGKELDD